MNYKKLLKDALLKDLSNLKASSRAINVLKDDLVDDGFLKDEINDFSNKVDEIIEKILKNICKN